MNRPKTTIYIAMLVAVLCVLQPDSARAFAPETYAENSRLAEGRWMKISVESDGLYLISNSTLRSWGFTDAGKVRVYGNGGRRLPDVLNKNTYVDDLAEVQTIVTDRGIVFYGAGPGEWTRSTAGAQLYYYKQNNYTSAGHYFVGEVTDGSERRGIEQRGSAGATDAAESFEEYVHHELDRTPSPGEAGPELLGEDMLYTRSRTFTFDAPDATSDTEGHFLCSFVSSMTSTGQLTFTINGSPMSGVSTDRVAATSSSSYIHGNETLTAHTFKARPASNGTYQVGITFQPSGRCTGAWLNFISLCYKRRLALPSAGYLKFATESQALSLSGAGAGITVLDVTDPANITQCPTNTEGGKATWTSTMAGRRTYVAYNPSATLPQPKTVGRVANQNLHADRDLDMVIIAPSLFASHAERLAAYHGASADSLHVKVVTPELIYNEFSSGNTDPGAFRRYFKMLYDRGKAGDGRPLRYALMMGRTSQDNRGISTAASSFPTIPMWMTSGARSSLSDNDGYCTDDITAMLEDGSGSSFGRDKLSIAIGRMPVVSLEEAANVVDKALQYAQSSKKTSWKHRVMFLADDKDNGVHVKQTESMIRQLERTSGQQHLVRKVYIDAYPFVGSNYPEARSTMFRYLDEGVVWWSYIGHANTTGWTAEGQLSYTDLNNMYLRHWPFIYAATCNFLRLDGNFISGGEILYKERYGGAIGMISATRPVYITDNGMLSDAIGRALARRDEKGMLPTPGEIYRTAKNDIRNNDGSLSASTNHLRYVFIGDPALRLATPSNIVQIDSLGNEDLADIVQPTLAALQQTTLKGSIRTPDGHVINDFNGTVVLDIFDAERSRNTLGQGNGGTVEVFQDYGDRIFCGSGEVRNGLFSVKVAMPAEIEQNFTPATITAYAYATTDDGTEAVGVDRQFYVYGTETPEAPDTEAPRIDRLVLNHDSFGSGDAVNSSPMLIADISDNTGINISSAGVGHQMTATLDRTKTFTDLSLYFTPSADGSPAGTINYPFDDLQPGNHTLALRVWDTAGNSATREIDFFVEESLAPRIYDVYTDANPARTSASFYISHDQPDGMATVTVEVFSLLGRPVWSGTTTGRSDMFTTVPVTWDLSDNGGRRVPRGIYLYRATVTADGVSHQTATRRLAVASE